MFFNKTSLLVLCTAAIAVNVSAYPQTGTASRRASHTNDDGYDFHSIDWEGEHKFMPPGPDDVRGPCPGLNTLANHGFLPRSGFNITVPIMEKAAFEGYRFEIGTIRDAAKISLSTNTEGPDFFSLEDIRMHGNIEHDASFSREDILLGNSVVFNETIFQTLKNSNPGADVYNVTSAGEVQRLRLADSKARNPEMINTIQQFLFRNAESGFYLSIMGDVEKGEAPKKFVQVFFEQERLPIEEGWRGPVNAVNEDNLGALVGRIIQADPTWAPNEGQFPWIRRGDNDVIFQQMFNHPEVDV